MKNALLIFAFLSFYLSSVHASVEIRSNKLTTGDGLANNSIRYMFGHYPETMHAQAPMCA